MKRVLVDTNMLLVPGQFNVDIFSEIERILDEPYEIAILQGSLDELRNIGETASAPDKRAAKLAMMLIEHQRAGAFPAAERSQCKGLKIIPGSGDVYVDDAIVRIAEDDTLVATNDAELKRRLLERGVRVIFLKQQQYLSL
jgi:rRNA-processing protein FCF1